MGIATAAIYSECDRAALHVRLADEAWAVGPSAPRESYLRIDAIIDAAKQAGGGGKGMRMVATAADLAGALRAARSEAQSAFGDGAVYLERRIMSPRHIEVQLLGDHHGTVLPFVERECSIQRRHQKVIEESPSLAVSPELRRRITSAAAAVAKGVGYTN